MRCCLNVASQYLQSIWPAKLVICFDVSSATHTGLTRRKRCSEHTTQSRQRLTQTRLGVIGDRAMRMTATQAWNSLPAFITASASLPTFRRRLELCCLLYLFITVDLYRVPCPRSLFLMQRKPLRYNNNNNNNLMDKVRVCRGFSVTLADSSNQSKCSQKK